MIILLLMIQQMIHADEQRFVQLKEQLQYDLSTATKLKNEAFFLPFHQEVSSLKGCLKEVDKAQDRAPKVYLQQLRTCEKRSKKYDAHYVMALRKAIAKDDHQLFQVLVEVNPRILQKDRWRDKAVAYYQKSREEYPFKVGEQLLAASEEEAYYRQLAAAEMENYEANVKVLSFDQARHSRDKSGKVRKFFVGYKKQDGTTRLIAQNQNSYPVTLLVRLESMRNYTTRSSSPFHIEIGPHTKLEVMRLSVKDRRKKASIRWAYSWVMGREDVHHDNRYLYALPFKQGSRVIVSQGFNGKATHTGRSRYAVDFVADVGTRIYAARGGKIIATESSYDQGGFDLSFGKYANYIVVEHVDGTMGKYYHLKQDGVMVKVGQYVSKGQFIGLSGNTGYTSGPHLHFGVYKVDSDYRSTISLPIRFQTNLGVVDAPKKGDIFKVVR